MVDTLVGVPLAEEEKDGMDELIESAREPRKDSIRESNRESIKDKPFSPFDDSADLVPDELSSGPELQDLLSSPDFGVELSVRYFVT